VTFVNDVAYLVRSVKIKFLIIAWLLSKCVKATAWGNTLKT